MDATALDARRLAHVIDHTLLKPEATAAQIDKLCDECLAHGFIAACVNPVWVERVAARLDGGATRVCTVAGFPLGASLPDVKATEARRALEQGAVEIDMVVSIAALISGDTHAVARDIAAVVNVVKSLDEQALVKVILETAVLDESQIELGCRCAVEARADFVKTSTGFHPAGGARAEHVALLRRHAPGLKVKAAGGIRDLATARALLAAGADRLGMSASVAVIEQLRGG